MSAISVAGNLVREAELKFSAGGQAVVNFSVAEGSRKKNEVGEWEDGDTSYFDVVAFGSLAENVSEMPKGTRLLVAGRLQQRSWEDKETGQKRSKVEIVADEVGPSLRWATAEVTRKAAEGNGKAKASSGGGGGYR